MDVEPRFAVSPEMQHECYHGAMVLPPLVHRQVINTYLLPSLVPHPSSLCVRAWLASTMVATESAALHSLSIAFQRKGIVAGPAFELAPPVQSLVDALKTRCAQVLSSSGPSSQRPPHLASTRELYSNIQLWKERSLHQTLQVIDTVAQGAASNASVLHESHIQAIELHEQAAKELFDLVVSFLQRTAVLLDCQLDEFAAQLAGVLNELVKPELEEQLEHERMLVARLVEQKLQLERARIELQSSHDSLHDRLTAIENAPEGGGDAILCNKLRGRVHQLAESEKELRERVESLTIERDTCKWEATRLQQKLEGIQHTLNLTCAMHEKETKQLVALANMNYEQVSRVMKASSSPSASNLISYDSNSGLTIVHQSPSSAPITRPPSSPAKTRLVTMQRPSPPCSPNQKRQILDEPLTCGAPYPDPQSSSPRVQPTATVPPSPRGQVLRPFAPRAAVSAASPRSDTSSPSHKGQRDHI